MNDFSNKTLVLILLLSLSMKAQVTIGSSQPPIRGALLELTEGLSTRKGIAMPRVKITNMFPSSALELAKSIGNATDNYHLSGHIGLTVYNQNEDHCAYPEPICKGLHVWDGNRWQNVEVINNFSKIVKTFVDNRPNDVPQTYRYRAFGVKGQPDYAGEWMLENLRAKFLPDGTAIDLNMSRTSTIRYIYPYVSPLPNPLPEGSTGAKDGTDPYYITQYPAWGMLYSWHAAAYGNTSTGNQGQGGVQELLVGGQGICPNGWHLPSDKEWNDLERHIYNNAHLYSTYTQDQVRSWPLWQSTWEGMDGFRPIDMSITEAQGFAMMTSCSLPYTNSFSKGKSNVMAEGGFAAIPVGRVLGDSFWLTYNTTATFWTYSASKTDGFRSRIFHHSTPRIDRSISLLNNMYSVRCKKNE